jgi:hypothetical protein
MVDSEVEMIMMMVIIIETCTEGAPVVTLEAKLEKTLDIEVAQEKEEFS